MRIAVYCGASSGFNPIYNEKAKKFGEWLGKNNHELVYGGGNVGLMGELANAVLENNGKVTGIMPDFLIKREIAHNQLTELITVESMSERKMKMLEQSDICVALPGGPGTLEEIVEAISWTRVGQSTNPCIFMNFNGYYDGVRKFYQHMNSEGFLSQEDLDRIGFLNEVEEIEPFINDIKDFVIREYRK